MQWILIASLILEVIKLLKENEKVEVTPEMVEKVNGAFDVKMSDKEVSAIFEIVVKVLELIKKK